MPWWLLAFCLFLAGILFNKYVEVIMIGYFADLIYAWPSPYINEVGFPLFYTLGAIAIYYLSDFIRTRQQSYV